jgi:hypothetical protein
MTLTFGRAVLPDPSSVSSSGAFVTFSGVAYSSAATAANRAAEVQMLEAQVLGMVGNPDEDAFPVVWSAESKWDGFYTEIDASWDWVNDGSGRVSVANWSITGRKVTDFASPRIETTGVAVVQTNGVSITSGTAYMTAFSSADAAELQKTSTVSVTRARSGEDGTVVAGTLAPTSSAAVGSFSVSIDPANYYAGGCALEIRGADDVWYEFVGRDIPASATNAWRLSNGIIRIGPSTLEVYDGGWQSIALKVGGRFTGAGNIYPTNIGQVQTSLGTPTENLCPSVLRNDRSCVVLKFNTAPGQTSTSYNGQTLLTLRAGQTLATLAFTGILNKYGVMLAGGTDPISAFTGGGIATSADAAGNKWVICATQPMDAGSYTDGYVAYLSTAAAVTAWGILGVGWDLFGSSSSVLEQLVCTANVTTRVVAR